MLGPADFKFLGAVHQCVRAEDWRPADASRLWAYNLHYFDDLNARDSASRERWHAALLTRWIEENPPGTAVAWEPYPTSRRIVNWIKWALRPHPMRSSYLASLAIQVRWLAQRVEYHLLGNHLLANAKALIFAGHYFSGVEAEKWCARGMRILSREIAEQVLVDGGHFERSPMYHATVLEDLLDLANLRIAYGRAVPDDWLDAIARMRAWLAAMTHPDGEVAFFNDSATGIAPKRADLEAYAERLGIAAAGRVAVPIVVLEASGYVRLISGSAEMIVDCGPVGPDYQPGHAHADTLSFELSVAGRRVLVNSGTSTYEPGPERDRQRGSSAHNTVVVDGADSSEVWGGFRVARRARAVLKLAHEVDGARVVEGSHDGFRRLSGRNMHRRRWALSEQGLRIDDEVTGRFQVAEAHFHLHPDIDAVQSDAGSVVLKRADGWTAVLRFTGANAVRVSDGSWHPGFGRSAKNRHVVAVFSAAALRTELDWAQ